jgi:DNA-binding response OmpR family regulator
VARKTVLIVDDSPLIQQIVADAFKPRGFEVLRAGDGSEGLRQVSETRPDVIVADILMPVMDGWRFCEEVRRNPTTFDIPFIFLTTESEVRKRVRGLRLGADDFLTKPFAPEELVARAEKLLERAERFRRLTAATNSLSGHTEHLPVADLLQILSLNGKTGSLRLEGRSDEVGRIHFDHGRIVHCELGEVLGVKALFRLMMWPEARFVLEPLAEGIERTIEGTTASVLMEGFTHWDEIKDLGERIPAEGRRYRLRSKVDTFLEHLDLSPVESDLISALMEGLTLGEILDKLPQRDLDIYRALIGLVEKEFLEPAQEVDTQPLRRQSHRQS